LGTKPVEYALIASELKEIDALMERAEHALNWNSDGIWNYMEKLRSLIMDLSLRVSKAQENVDSIKKTMLQWKESPLFVRNEDHKSEGLINVKGAKTTDTLNELININYDIFADMPEKKNARYEEIGESGQKIVGLIKDCQKYFQATEESENWKRSLNYDNIHLHRYTINILSSLDRYLTFVDEIIVHGLLKTAASSLSYLLDETDHTITQGILFEVNLVIHFYICQHKYVLCIFFFID